MGNKISSVFWRKINRFNVENRAHRVLENNPQPAPKFRSNEDDLKRTLEYFPDYLEKEKEKDINLDERLKKVYVTSQSEMVESEKLEPEVKPHQELIEKKLPLNRSIVEDFEYGYKESTKIAIGYTSLRNAMQFISDHQNEPDTWTSKRIAEQYKLKIDRVEHIIKYFRTFQIFIPDKNLKEKILSNSTSEDTKKIESQQSQG